MEDRVRVLRVVQYEGPRAAVERQISMSLHGRRVGLDGLSITAVTLDQFPQVLAQAVASTPLPLGGPYEVSVEDEP